MDFTVPDEYKMIQTLTRQFVEAEMMPQEGWINEHGITKDDYQKLIDHSKELGLFMPGTPAKYGGVGMESRLCWMMMSEEYGKSNPMFDLFFGGGPMFDLDDMSDYLRDNFFLPHARGEKWFGMAATEPTTGGSDQASMQTTARRDGDNWVINGSKCFITEGDMSDFYITLARTELDKPRGGVSMFIVEKDRPGLTLGREQKTMAWPMTRQFELYYDDVVIPDINRLTPSGQGMSYWAMMIPVARTRVGSWGVGGAQRCLDLGVSYAKDRVTFGKPLSYRQSIQWMLADSAMEIQATRLMIYHTAWKTDQGENAITDACMCKVMGSELACRVADRIIQVYGGHGYTTDFPMERIWRMMRGGRIYEGGNEIMYYIISRQLLDLPSMTQQ